MSITVKARSPSRAPPSRRSRVTPGRSSTSARRLPTRRLNSVDLPTFGRPTMATVKLMGLAPARCEDERSMPRPRPQTQISATADRATALRRRRSAAPRRRLGPSAAAAAAAAARLHGGGRRTVTAARRAAPPFGLDRRGLHGDRSTSAWASRFALGFGGGAASASTAACCAAGGPAGFCSASPASGGGWLPLTSSGGTPCVTPGTPSGNTALRSPGSGFLLSRKSTLNHVGRIGTAQIRHARHAAAAGQRQRQCRRDEERYA